MFKFIICALLTLSLISSCNNEDDPKGEDDPNGPAEPTTTPDETTIDPKGKYKLVNKTGDDDVVEVILFKSYEKLKNNDSTECAPVVLQAEQCLTITGGQFHLLQIVLDEEKVCGTTITSCNPGNYEVTATRLWYTFWIEFKYHLSELQEETKTPPNSRKNQKSDEKKEVEKTEEEPKTCTPLECKKPDDEPTTEPAADDDEGDESDEGDSPADS